MHRHRLAPGAEYYRLPQPPAPPVTAAGFVAVPLPPLGGAAAVLAELYRQALEQAREAARPGLPERDLLAAWN